jgi:uncharacterized membrane protein
LDFRFLIASASRRTEAIIARESRTALVVWGFVASFCLLLLVAIIAAPVALAVGHTGFASAIYKSFSFLCHQIPERSFHIAGHKFAVCSRCTGLYSGFAFATLGYPIFRSLKRTDTPRIIWLLLSAVPLLIDFSLTYFGIWQNTHLTRFTTGALFGAVAAIYILPGLIELSASLRRRLQRPAQTQSTL